MANHDINNTQLNGDSLNISEQRKKELKQLFPGIFTETKTDDGKLVESIDFERLKAELGQFSEIYDNRRERYAMDWPGKKDTLRQIQEPSRATLKPCREESVDFDSTENLFIEGDNLEVLKLLQKSYYGAVKMIYIDPPYNTGKEFIYPDNFTESLDTYLEYAGLKEVGGEGRKFSTNSQSEGRFHSKWLNMMYPRLYLARNLLREDGVIFISIDDNEVENLRRIGDEIFGEENFLALFPWRTDGNFDNQAKIKNCHEYILAYCKQVAAFPPPPVIDPNVDNDSKLFKADIINTIVKNGPKNPVSKVVLPKGFPSRFSEGKILSRNDAWPHFLTDALVENNQLVNSVTVESGWSSKELLLSFIENDFFPVLDIKGQETRFELTNSGAIEAVKKRGEASSHVISTLQGFGGSQKAQQELESLGIVFDDYPKPTKLLTYLLKMQHLNDFIALDFFAGSGSFAHAAFNLAAELNKNISCISIQLPEVIDSRLKAYDAGYRKISDIAKERLRRAGAKIRSELEGQLDLDNQQSLDLGFKVFKLDQSNFKQWQAPSKDTSNDELVRQMELHIDPVDQDATQEDLLYEILLKNGVKPTEQIEKIELAGHPVYSITEGTILIHLEKHTDQALMDAVLDKQPMEFICLDSAFHGNEQMKANAVKSFATFNQEKDGDYRIDFKTV
ncbi:site-specific DNA-methyltransferase [Marinomonas shanghaiensis]|uniref:site-specific DNA-methyltransferase n=1 Tax=Marinomonas shanghaiensis TaxID=2202418 RepID=UPI000DB92244|nr:site-specific DNA-methyltransferase [Marinomonas shanghaiensis]